MTVEGISSLQNACEREHRSQFWMAHSDFWLSRGRSQEAKVWHLLRAWTCAFSSLSLSFGKEKNGPSHCIWSRPAPLAWARTMKQSVGQLWKRQTRSLNGQDWDIQQRKEWWWHYVRVLFKDLWTAVTHFLSLISKVDELIGQMDSCSKERRGQEFGFDQLSKREAKIILASSKYIKQVYIGRKRI